MNNDIKNIYNTLAVMYNDFIKDLDMKKYNDRAAELSRIYKGNDLMFNFCTCLIITWAPVINHIKHVSVHGNNGG